jgi:hypothetical protein
MRYFLLGVILALTMASPAAADAGLTAAVAAVYGQRTVDAGLHAIAHDRAQEISSCGSCLNHDLMRPGTAEVLGYNSGHPNPTSAVISAWQGSAAHNGILSDLALGRIGCAEVIVGGSHFFACVLAAGGGQTSAVDPPAPAAGLPDTAMR